MTLRTWRRTILLPFLWGCLLVGGFPGVCGAAPVSGDQGPLIRDVYVNQAGSNLCVLEIDGLDLPAPQPQKQPSSDKGLRFLLEAPMDDQGMKKDFSLPLVRWVSLEKVPQGTLLTVRGDYPLDCTSVTGQGTTRLVFQLARREEAVPTPTEAPPRKTVSGLDPLSLSNPVTLSLRDAELRDVFRMLADLTGYNILCDPSVPPGNVTLTVKAVPLREVFAYLMRTYDVTYAMMGKTILVGKADPLAKALGREETQAFQIAYGDLKQIPGQIQTLFALAKPVVVDERLRTIYVSARKDQMESIRKFLDKADHPGQQVMLQARIVEIGDDGKEELESLISRVYKNWWFAFDNNGGMIGYTRINKPDLYDDDANDNRIVKPGGLDLSVVAQNPDLNFLDAGLRALETANKGRMLASPSVVVHDGKKAKIALTENVKYISARDQAGNPTYSEERVGPTIEFTPTIGRDRVITMEMTLKTGEVTKYIRGGMGEQVPQTSTREVNSTVRIRNGEPFVVGGLFRDGQTHSENKIPILGDIPLLGELFRNRTTQKIHTEVAMIVIPYLLDVPASGVSSRSILLTP